MSELDSADGGQQNGDAPDGVAARIDEAEERIDALEVATPRLASV